MCTVPRAIIVSILALAPMIGASAALEQGVVSPVEKPENASRKPIPASGKSTLLTKVIPGDMFASIKKGVADGHLAMIHLREDNGPNAKPLVWEALADGGILIGFHVNVPQRGQKNIEGAYSRKGVIRYIHG